MNRSQSAKADDAVQSASASDTPPTLPVAVAGPPSEFSTFHVYWESATTCVSVSADRSTDRSTWTGTGSPCAVSRSARTPID